MLFPKIDFNGSLEPKHRQRLKHIREMLGLTYKDFGNLIGCDWSTVLKWENGDSHRSQPAMTDILTQIFQGSLDCRLAQRKVRLRISIEAKLNELIDKKRSGMDHR